MAAAGPPRVSPQALPSSGGMPEPDTLAAVAASGRTQKAREMIADGMDVNSTDAQGRTPVMHAVLGGHLDTAVQLALSGADLRRRDPHGRTVMELAVLASNREAALALLLIATAKFTRPLSPLLPLTSLLRLQQWVLDRAGKNSKAAAVVRDCFGPRKS